MTSPQVIVTRPETPGYAKAAGVIGLILAILGMLIPVFGVLFVTPLAIVTGAIALYAGSKGLGVAALILIVLNLVISPTFWLNVGAGATQAGAAGNRFLSYFDAIGVVVMFVLLVRKPR